MTQKRCGTCYMYNEGKCRWRVKHMPWWLDDEMFEENDHVRMMDPDDGEYCETWIGEKQ